MGGLAKGLAVIKAFSRDHSALTLSEIAASARMPAATARRCLLTLEELGYVTRRGRAFLLRPKVLELGAAYLESMDIEHLTKTHLEELARVTGDSAALSVLDGNDIVYVARTSVRTLVRLEAHVGSRFPAHVTSMGRVLLAGVEPERLDQYFRTQKFVALTTQTVTDPKQAAPAHRGMPPQRLLGRRRRTGLWRGRGRGAGVRPVGPRGRRAQQLQPLAARFQGLAGAPAPGDAAQGEPRDLGRARARARASRSARRPDDLRHARVRLTLRGVAP